MPPPTVLSARLVDEVEPGVSVRTGHDRAAPVSRLDCERDLRGTCERVAHGEMAAPERGRVRDENELPVVTGGSGRAGGSRRSAEADRAAAFLARYEQALADEGVPADNRESESWSSLARTLLASNEFLFVD